MKPGLDAGASEVLDIVTANLVPGRARTIDCRKDSAPALHVFADNADHFTLGHYLVEPLRVLPIIEVEVWRSPQGAWLPICLRRLTLPVRTAVLVEAGVPRLVRSDLMDELTQVVSAWLGHLLLAEQGGLDPIRKAASYIPPF